MDYDYKYGNQFYKYLGDKVIKSVVYNILAPAQEQDIQPGMEYEMKPLPIFDNPDYIGSGKLKNKSSLEIDFLPNINNLYNFLTDRDKEIGGTVEDILESIFNYKLMFVLLKKSGIKTNTKWNELKETEKHKLCETIKNFSANIIGTLDFDRAQTCSGGIPLNEINETMQSKYNKNLYFTGEIIDVNGDCGGYNLAFSFITGYICGRNLNDSN